VTTIEYCSQAFTKFRAAPDDHNKSIGELKDIYGVSKSTLTKWRSAVGIKSQSEMRRKRLALLRSQPDYGQPGEPAPVIADVIAKRLGLCASTVQTARRKDGIEPPIVRRNQHGECKRCPTKKEREIAVLCRLTRTWGVPCT